MKIDKVFEECGHFIDMFGVWIYITDSKKRFKRMLDHVGVDHGDMNTYGRTFKTVSNEDGRMRIYIYFTRDEISTLVHESIHAAEYILDHIGEPPSWDGEIFAYLTQHIFEFHLNRRKDKNG